MTSKPNLLLLHGALGASDQFQALTVHLREEYSVHTYDFPGHGGKAFAEEPLSIPVLAKHLEDHLVEFHLVGCHVFGYSMGGYVALWLEALKPGLFSSIMTLGTKFNWTRESAEKEAKMIDPSFLTAKVPRFAETLKLRHAPGDWTRLSAETMHLMLHLAKHPLGLDAFGQITCKTRIALGDRDQMVSIAETESTYTALPNASLLILPETAHALEKVNHSYLAMEIKHFLQNHGI
ncbi:MAG: alpha/beta hydrolase [Bacteroidia bacterium]|nr:alpha/beta hydrolase [Bacteroidia bacterium]